jgi:hypothetical protein
MIFQEMRNLPSLKAHQTRQAKRLACHPAPLVAPAAILLTIYGEL